MKTFIIFLLVIILFPCTLIARTIQVTWDAPVHSQLAGFTLRINGGDAINVVAVDQKVNGGQWNTLGTYTFNDTAKVVVISSGNSTSTCADAIKFVSADSELIIDNGGLGTSSVGQWQVSGGANPYGADSLYSKDANGTYTFAASLQGTYEVLLWWTEWSSRSSNVLVKICDEKILDIPGAETIEWTGDVELHVGQNVFEMQAYTTDGEYSDWSEPAYYVLTEAITPPENIKVVATITIVIEN